MEGCRTKFWLSFEKHPELQIFFCLAELVAKKTAQKIPIPPAPYAEYIDALSRQKSIGKTIKPSKQLGFRIFD
jgi:hypothetical protein